MIKFDKTEVFNLEGALRGMRNPLQSWDKSDSKCCKDIDSCNDCALTSDVEVCCDVSEMTYVVGKSDYKLAMTLANAGSDHAKFMRQIFISVDITAPLYWWKEMDTYKVGTVANSESTMHKLGTRELTHDDFSWDDEEGYPYHGQWRNTYLKYINSCIRAYQLNKSRHEVYATNVAWRRIVQDLSSSYNQKRTWTANYEVLHNIYHSRHFHKLVEWIAMCKWIESLPYSELITTKRT